MAIKPYIGITGPTSVEQTQKVVKEFSNAGFSWRNSHVPMIGFLVNYKTLNGQEVQNRRYPAVNTLPDLLKATNGQALTMVHYNSDKEDTLSYQVDYIFNGIYETGLCRALQLNIPWPDIEQVANIKKRFSDMKIVFQASSKAMQGKTPKQIAQGIKDYEGLINYVLIDRSGGNGIPIKIDSSVEVYSEIKEELPDLTIGFAGGFTSENVAPRLIELRRQVGDTNFFIDAESGLRDKISSIYGDDILNMDKVKGYLKGASIINKN